MVAKDIKSKYKKTEIGVIPEDWDLISYGDAFNFLSTASYSRAELSADGDVCYIHYGDIHTKWNHFLDLKKNELPKISRDKAKKYSFIEEGDVVMADASEDYEGICKSVEIKNIQSTKIISGLHTFLMRDKSNIFANGFKGYIHSNGLLKNQYDRLATGLKVYGVSKTNLKKILIPYPKDLKEQEAIAIVLSDTDKLVESLNSLISKKKDLKQGTMQLLLTRKKRLKGFEGKWDLSSIKKMVEIPVTDGPHLTPNFIERGVPFLSVNNIVDNKIDWFNGIRFISKEDDVVFSRKCKPKKGDILLGKAASVGHVAVVEIEIDFNIWSPLALIRLKKSYDSRFIYYCFQTRDIINQIKLLTNSSSQGNIGMGDIGKLEFYTPRIEEQRAIVDVLSSMDEEIEALEQKRDKYSMIKKGMTQQLLTGSIRLK